MFFSRIQNLISVPVVLLTIGALLLGFLCVGMFHEQSMRMDMSHGQTMPLEESCCGTTMSEHIQTWKNMLLIAPQGVRDVLTLLALGLVLVFAHSWFSFRDRYPSLDRAVERLLLYVRENPDIAIFNHLKLAFARGILNPKIY